jgi:hypothetical protein
LRRANKGALNSRQNGQIHLGFQLHRDENETTVSKETKKMLWTIFVVLIVLWLLGLVTSYTFGGFVHILLILAVVVLIFQLVAGRRVI